MWEGIIAVLIPIIKIIFEKISKKKLDDKEFVEHILAHQKLRSRAGDAAMSWEKALEEAQKDLATKEVDTTKNL